MSIDISQLPEYGQAMASFQAAKGKAEVDGDGVALAQATAKWAEDRAALTTRAYQQQDRQRQVEAARTAAAAKYPDVDPSLYANVDDPVSIDAQAARIQENINKHKTSSGDAGTQSWGESPPAGNPGGTPPPTEESDDEKLARLVPIVRDKGRNALAENKQVRHIALSPILDRIEANSSAVWDAAQREAEKRAARR